MGVPKSRITEMYGSESGGKTTLALSIVAQSPPDNGEQALEIMELLVRSGVVDIVVADSVAALTLRAEIKDAMGTACPAYWPA